MHVTRRVRRAEGEGELTSLSRPLLDDGLRSTGLTRAGER